jgi:hypothetical protein
VAIDRVVLAASAPGAEPQTIDGQMIEITETGIRLRPWSLRVLTPGQLDDLAAEAGLALAARYGGWEEEPFGEDSDAHVTVYRSAHAAR